jgi:predicted phosphodiesterase
MSKKIGVFLSDIHFPDNIDLGPVFKYIKDLKPNLVILGGDIIDAKGLHGVESMTASQIKMEWYDRDCKLMSSFMQQLHDIVPKAELVFLEGNHEERYQRIVKRYPDAWGGRFDFYRDVVKKVYPKAKWIPYGDYNSYFKLGDTVFTHGTVYPENHSRKYAQIFSPFKVVYGHLHHYQACTIHSAMPALAPHYAVTAGCLSTTAPEWKKGQPNCWKNGFIEFFSDGKETTPQAIIFDSKGRFTVCGKTYG